MPQHNPRQSCVELLQQMVAINTVNRVPEGVRFVEAELIEYLESTARAWGLQTRRLEIPTVGCNLLVTREVDPVGRWLMFDSHLDTVSVDGMTIDPFAGVIEDGKLYGRGACDTKGTGAAMLWALQSLAAEDSNGTNIAILYSIEEEISRTGVKAFVNDQLATLDWTPSAVVVGEPTCLRVVTAHNGTVRWEISTFGRASHSSDPSQGHSAISDMCRVIEAIEGRYIPNLQSAHELVGKAQCSVNLISGGSLINVIPDSCTISIDRRIVPGEDGTQVVPAVESVLSKLRCDAPELRVQQHEPDIQRSLAPDKNQDFARHIGNVLQSLGLDPNPVGVKYGTHASDFAAVGLPAIVLGPGDIAQAHCKDEFIDLEELERGVGVYRNIMCAGIS